MNYFFHMAIPDGMFFIIFYGLQNQPAKAAAELTEAREANQFTCSPTNCDEVIQSFIRYGAKFIKRFYDTSRMLPTVYTRCIQNQLEKYK
jgi:hypothetical protein